MLNKDWLTWKNEDWVRRLGDAIFLRKEGEPQTFQNISSSPRLLLEISGDNSSANDTGQLTALTREVLRIHQNNCVRAFDYSKWTPSQEFKDSCVYPQYLTLLFLTIKAASAAENNHGEGDFRDRLKIILSKAGIQVANVELAHLPEFWQALHTWNKEAIQQDKLDIKLIDLPRDVGNETLIGYSKRIAFPSYRDQEKLNRSFLMTGKIESHYSPARICNELRGSSGFSENFLTHVKDLYLKVSKGEQVAHHPVITTIEDINWETELARKKDLGDFEVRVSEINVDHMNGFRLLGDLVARQNLARYNSEVAKESPGDHGTISHLITGLSFVNLLTVAKRLGGPNGSNGQLLRLRPFSMLTNDFLLLCRSSSLEYVSTYKVKELDDYIVYFLSKYEQDLLRRSQSLDLGQDPEVINIGQEYRLVRFSAIRREDLYDLLLCLSPAGKGLENLATREQPISERLFSRINKVYLWSAVTPVKFVFQDGSIPHFKLTGEEGNITDKFEPLDGQWVINPARVKSLTYPRELVVYSALLGQNRVSKAYSLVHALPEPTLIDGQKFSDYYYANTKGGLSPARDIFSFDHSGPLASKRPESANYEFKSNLSKQILEPSLNSASDSVRFPQLARSTIEHLLLRFQLAKGLSWGNYQAYISALSLASRMPWQSVDKLFKNSALVFTAYNYQSCGSAIAPLPRLVSAVRKDGKNYARLTGLVAPIDVKALEECGFKCVREGLGIGAIAFRPFVFEIDPARSIEELVGRLGASLIEEETFSKLLEQEKSSQYSSPKAHSIDKEIENATEVFLNGKWEKAYEGSCFSDNRIYRKQTFSSTRYFVMKAGELIETRSSEWAFLLFWSKDGVLGEHDRSGNIKFGRNVTSLPPLFTAWWMHFGGGAVSCTSEGNLLLKVDDDFGKKASFEEFLPIKDFEKQKKVKKSIYLERRKIALRKIHFNKNSDNDAC